MYILNQSQTEIHNSEFVERFCIAEKPDAVLIVASIARDKQPNTIGRYCNMKEARDVLFELFFALRLDETSYEMPLSKLKAEEHKIMDARTKRKGGS